MDSDTVIIKVYTVIIKEIDTQLLSQLNVINYKHIKNFIELYVHAVCIKFADVIAVQKNIQFYCFFIITYCSSFKMKYAICTYNTMKYANASWIKTLKFVDSINSFSVGDKRKVGTLVLQLQINCKSRKL